MHRNSKPIDVQAILKIAAFFIIGISLLYYLFFQARFLIAGPDITLTTKLDPVYNERIIEIAGSSKNITEITLNGRTIYTDESGNFSEPLVLQNGYTIMYLQAVDRYGRETHIERSFVYRPASSINL